MAHNDGERWRLAFYDQAGRPMTQAAWEEAFARTEARIIRQETVGYGPNRKWVSTVWLGLDHRAGRPGPPLIFETMVFQHDHALAQQRYATNAEAVAGHQAMVTRYRVTRRQRRRSERTPPHAR